MTTSTQPRNATERDQMLARLQRLEEKAKANYDAAWALMEEADAAYKKARLMAEKYEGRI